MEKKLLTKSQVLKGLNSAYEKIVELEHFVNSIPLKLHKMALRALLYQCESLLMNAYKLAQYDFEFQEKSLQGKNK